MGTALAIVLGAILLKVFPGRLVNKKKRPTSLVDKEKQKAVGELSAIEEQADLVRMVAEGMECPDGSALGLADSLFAAMKSALIEGNRIEVGGFGALETKDVKVKPGARNPRTG